MKETAAFIENDAVSCFDQIVNPLVLLFPLCLRLSKTVVASLAQTWEKTVQHIRTQYGVSEEFYENDVFSLLFGTGQGATLGPFLWLLCFILIALCIPPHTPRLHHIAVDNSLTLSQLGEPFNDDTSLGCSFLSPDTPPVPVQSEYEKFQTFSPTYKS
jgi:hypothetical protein